MPGTIMDGLFPGASDPYGCGLAIGWGMVGGGALGGAAAGGITAGVAAPAGHSPTPAMAPDTWIPVTSRAIRVKRI